MIVCRRMALAGSFAILLTAGAAAQDGIVTGIATYRERIALPPGAVLEVSLLDISRGDAPPGRIATARIEVIGQVPIPFTLRYDTRRIEQGKTYAVEATLLIGDLPAFRSDRLRHAPMQDAASRAELLLRRIGARQEEEQLVGPRWIVQEIGGRGLPGRQQPDISFTADGRAYGSGGCNRFTGGYTMEGASLRFGAMASTNMACEPAAMDREQRFHAALAEVRAYRMENGRLYLLDGGGGVLVRLSRAG